MSFRHPAPGIRHQAVSGRVLGVLSGFHTFSWSSLGSRIPDPGSRCWPLRAFLLATFFLLALTPQTSPAQAFPFYDEYESLDRQDPVYEKWILYPFYLNRMTTNTTETTIHPFFSRYEETDSGRNSVDALWPIFSYRYFPDRLGAEDYTRYFLFPFYFFKEETRFERRDQERFVFPFYYTGSQEGRGEYRILFPFFWYAYNARLSIPLFPPRQQTFLAFWPFWGDFYGYFNRDHIRFVMWPLYVYSSEGIPGSDDYNEIRSILWPFFGRYSGPTTRGLRVFPLFSYVEKDGEFTRASWLWPLGHYRTGRVSRTDDTQQDVTLFLPFYARFIRPDLKLNAVFPFYGRLETGERVSQGYLLAMFNREINYRRGIKEDRLFWFLIRRRTSLPGYDPSDLADNASTGGGVFPFYLRFTSPDSKRVNTLWPFGLYKWNKYRDYEWERTYVVPFYSDQERRFNNGDYVYNRFLFPFFRVRKTLDGNEYSNALHLFFYTYSAPVDRLYAPLWTFWEKRENEKAGTNSIRWFKNAYIYEKLPDGTTRRQMNLFFVKYRSLNPPDAPEAGRTQFLFGLLEKERDPDGARWKVLGKKVF